MKVLKHGGARVPCPKTQAGLLVWAACASMTGVARAGALDKSNSGGARKAPLAFDLAARAEAVSDDTAGGHTAMPHSRLTEHGDQLAGTGEHAQARRDNGGAPDLPDNCRTQQLYRVRPDWPRQRSRPAGKATSRQKPLWSRDPP